MPGLMQTGSKRADVITAADETPIGEAVIGQDGYLPLRRAIEAAR